MKVKTSITLPVALLEEIDQSFANRSAFLELAARSYLKKANALARDASDAGILDRCAEQLNREAAEVLEYQGLPE
jgi:metal-responsive CopG/Arc/MetJ family transcriptional regulator